MLRVGLTGSIGVGKSFVTGVLNELGCHTLDADQTAREVVAPGSEGLKAVVGAFGKEVLENGGTLNRKRLGALVFENKKNRELLNTILHPIIIERQDQQINEWQAQDPKGIAVVDAALMIESGGYKRFDRIIVVHCRPEVQLQRLMDRDGLSRAEAEKRINSQMAQEDKLKFADFAIDTSEGFETTLELTEVVYRKLRHLADATKERSPE